MSLNLTDKAVLVQNGKSVMKCNKCGAEDRPHVRESHYTPRYKTWLYKVECAHCGAYIKFINEHQYITGEYI
jgi:hypothetical protein